MVGTASKKHENHKIAATADADPGATAGENLPDMI
jgi:hypothetical protein